MKTIKPNHLPGPWTTQPIGDESECNILGPNRELIATVADNEANLIAAAPELARFARAIEESVNDALRPGSPDTFMSLVKRLQDYRAWAKVAIAKAEGGL